MCCLYRKEVHRPGRAHQKRPEARKVLKEKGTLERCRLAPLQSGGCLSLRVKRKGKAMYHGKRVKRRGHIKKCVPAADVALVLQCALCAVSSRAAIGGAPRLGRSSAPPCGGRRSELPAPARTRAKGTTQETEIEYTHIERAKYSGIQRKFTLSIGLSSKPIA